MHSEGGFMNRKVVKLALTSVLLVGTLTKFAAKTAEAVGFGYSCPSMCCAYNRIGECTLYHQGYPAGNGLCYYEPCPGTGGDGTAS
jgi:hypothetical protein